MERELTEPLYFTVSEKSHIADMNARGRAQLASGMMDEIGKLDLAWECQEIEENPELSPEEKAQALRELQQNYDSFAILDVDDQLRKIEARTDLDDEERTRLITKVPRVAEQRWAKNEAIRQLLKAYTLYEKDDEYVVLDNAIVIVDEFTGRLMPGRRWSDGLHEAIEAKEGVKIERQTQTLATITFQNYFRMYKKLAGMTGTAETEAAEFENIYKLEVLVIPTNQTLLRHEFPDVVFRTEREKFGAVVGEIQELNQKGQPALVGTTSIEKSERISAMLKKEGIKHVVLNAKYHAREAEIVAQAGREARRDHRHQHGRPGHGHLARRQYRVHGPGLSAQAKHRPGKRHAGAMEGRHGAIPARRGPRTRGSGGARRPAHYRDGAARVAAD